MPGNEYKLKNGGYMNEKTKPDGTPELEDFPGKFCVLSVALDNPVMINRCLDISGPDPGTVRKPFAFFFVHGGGWAGGSRGQYYPIMQYVNMRGFAAAATGYRLCDKQITAFDQLLDVRQSYAQFVKYLQTKTGEANPKIVVMGSSAGAHLGSLLAYAKPGECGEPLRYKNFELSGDWVVPAALIAVCGTKQMIPWPGIPDIIWKSMQLAAGNDYSPQFEPLFKQLSPAAYFCQDSCPTFIVAAEHEMLFSNRLNREWHDELTQVGIRCEMKIYQGQSHGFLYYCDSPAQKQALEDVLNFVQSL